MRAGLVIVAMTGSAAAEPPPGVYAMTKGERVPFTSNGKRVRACAPDEHPVSFPEELVVDYRGDSVRVNGNGDWRLYGFTHDGRGRRGTDTSLVAYQLDRPEWLRVDVWFTARGDEAVASLQVTIVGEYASRCISSVRYRGRYHER